MWDREGNISLRHNNKKSITSKLTVPNEWTRDLSVCESGWLWEVDIQGRYTYCSINVKKFLGFPREQVIGKTPFDFMGTDESERVSGLFSKLTYKNLPIVDLINWNIKQNGTPVCFLTNGHPFYTQTGAFSGYRGSDKDITAFKPFIDKIDTLKNELQNETEQLEAMVTAYGVLLERKTPIKVEEKIVSNITEMIIPYLEKLKKEKLNKRQRGYLTEIEAQLKDITAPLFHNLNAHFSELTPTETKIAGLIKQGKTTKEIAFFLNSSIDAVKFHRYNLRKKFGIKNKKISLSVFLQKLAQV